jgi:hypothetical protein
MRSRVFIICRTQKFDTQSLEDYGERVFLLRVPVNTTNTAPLVRVLYDSLKDFQFDPMMDYVAVAGPHVHSMLLSALVAKVWGRMRLLVFSPHEGNYEETVLDLEEFDKIRV